MRKFIDKLRLFASLPDDMQHKIVRELEQMDDVSNAVEIFGNLVNKYVGIFTSNA